MLSIEIQILWIFHRLCKWNSENSLQITPFNVSRKNSLTSFHRAWQKDDTLCWNGKVRVLCNLSRKDLERESDNECTETTSSLLILSQWEQKHENESQVEQHQAYVMSSMLQDPIFCLKMLSALFHFLKVVQTPYLDLYYDIPED